MKFINGFKCMGFLDVTNKHQKYSIAFSTLVLMFNLFLVALLQVLHSPSKDSHMCLSPKQHPQSLGRTPEQKEKQTHQGDNCHVQ